MTNNVSPAPPFWPSRRLWVKFFLGFMYVPSLFYLLMMALVAGLFAYDVREVLLGVLFTTVLLGGPISVGLLLLPSWRGVGAGTLAAVGMVSTWIVVSRLAYYDVPYWLRDSLPVALTAGSGVAIIEVTTRDASRRGEVINLGTGMLIGVLLSIVYVSLVPLYAHSARTNHLVIDWSAYFALVWLSAFFFPEWFARRVSWGGLMVWTGLVALVFGVSLVPMK